MPARKVAAAPQSLIPPRIRFRHDACNLAGMLERMQFDEDELRLEARRRVASGRLPSGLPQYLWAGAGDGRPCSLCDRAIDAEQIEYEVQLNGTPLVLFRFHRICHEAWELECIR